MNPKDLSYLLSLRIGLAPMRFGPAELETIKSRLLYSEMIEQEEDKKVTLSERGNVYLDGILNAPLPVKAWVFSSTTSE